MADQSAYQKAMVICDLLGDVREGKALYDSRGSLNFTIKKLDRADCLITPIGDDMYSIKITRTFNMYQFTTLSKIDNVKTNELYSTLKKTIEYLENEWKNYNKNKTSLSWWGYGKIERYE